MLSSLTTRLTTATAYYTASALPSCIQFGQLSTRLHASSPASDSSTTSLTLYMTTCTATNPVQVVLTGQQVSVPYGAVVPSRHVHPSVGEIRPHSSAFCHSPWHRHSTDSLGTLWGLQFRRLGSSDLEHCHSLSLSAATHAPFHASVLRPTSWPNARDRRDGEVN